MSEKEKQAIAKVVPNKDISDKILTRVTELENTGGLQFPENYSYANAIKSAWLILQNLADRNKNLVLNSCTKESIANSLLDMVVQGLSPAKKQCYFIPYGKTLQLSRSYLGTIAVTKRLNGVKDVFAQVIYEDDEFEYTIDSSTGTKKVVKHEQKIENVDLEKIKAAYAIVIREGGEPFVEIMTMDQIKQAWLQGVAYASGKSKAHKNFTDEMAKKTVINRACKSFFNTSDDSDLLIEAINRTTDAEGLKDTEYEVVIETEVEEQANQQEIDLTLEEHQEVETETETKNEPEEVTTDRGF